MSFQVNFELSARDLERFYQAMRCRRMGGANGKKIKSPFSLI